MAERKQVDWDAVQRDRDAGMSVVGELEKKYGVSNVTIYAHTTGNGAKRPKAERTNERTNERSPRSKGSMKVASHGGRFNGSALGCLLSSELDSLRKKRDALSEIIERMEAIS